MIIKKAILLSLSIVLMMFTACVSKIALDGSNDSNPGNSLEADQILGSLSSFNVQYIRTNWVSIQHPTVTVISSKIELSQYIENYTVSDLHYAPDFLNAIENYTDTYFNSSILVIVTLEETSGSIRHEVKSINDSGDILINRLVPEIGTTDMAGWHIIIEVDSNSKLEKYRVVFL